MHILQRMISYHTTYIIQPAKQKRRSYSYQTEDRPNSIDAWVHYRFSIFFRTVHYMIFFFHVLGTSQKLEDIIGDKTTT